MEEQKLTSGQIQSQALTEDGYRLYMAKNFQSAIAYFKKAIEFDPNNESAFFWMGNSHIQLGDNEGYVRCAKKALEINPDNYWTRFGLGNVLKRMGQYDEALLELEEAKKNVPEGHEFSPYITIGQILYAQGKVEEAERNFLKARKLKPKEPFVEFSIGKFYYNTGDLGKAEEFIKPVVNSPTLGADARDEANIILCSIYHEKGEYDTAERYIDEVPEKGEFQGPVRGLKAKLRFKKKKTEIKESLEDLIALSETQPSAETFNKIGILYGAEVKTDDLEDYRQSLECFSRAYELDPKFSEARDNLLAIIRIDNKSDVATEFWRRIN